MAGLRQRGRGRRTMNEINMVPFIDVMLVLLIIFMVTAPLITPSMINLPSVSKAAAQPIQLLINQNSRIEIKPATGAPVASTLAGIGQAVKALQPEVEAGQQPTPVLITADKSVRYEIVVKVMDELYKAGVGRIALSVQTSQ